MLIAILAGVLGAAGVAAGVMIGRSTQRNASGDMATEHRRQLHDELERIARHRKSEVEVVWLRDQRRAAYARFLSAASARTDAIMARHVRRKSTPEVRADLQAASTVTLSSLLDVFSEVQLVAGHLTLTAATHWLEVLTEMSKQALDDNIPAFAKAEHARQRFLQLARTELGTDPLPIVAAEPRQRRQTSSVRAVA